MTKEELEITEIVNRETKAWEDVNLLISIFHPDMVWPGPELFNHTIEWIG